jgi:hypothetical protein
MLLWKTKGFERNHDFSVRVDRRVFDVEEFESEVRSLVSIRALWKTRGFERNREFSIRVTEGFSMFRNSNPTFDFLQYERLTLSGADERLDV